MAQPGPTLPITATPDAGGSPRRSPTGRVDAQDSPRWSASSCSSSVLALVAHPVRVQAHSMEPTYRPGDHLLVRSWGAGRDLPRRGDVVVVQVPDGGDLVKRVAAVAGDEVGIADGLLVVDGVEVKEPYLDQASVDGTWFGPVVVPPGHVFVLGDHRGDSVDSRRFGPIPVSAVRGTVVARLWPLRPRS